MKIEKKVLAASLLLILAMAVPAAAEIVVRAGSLREPAGIDPAQSWDDTSAFFVYNIFDTLVRFNPATAKIEPSLAVSWQASHDGRTWTFQLRRGVRFHDGTPLDADAVVFTFFRQMDPANPKRNQQFPLFADIFTFLKSVRKIDAQQVEFVLSEPYFPFLATLTVECAAIVPPGAVKKAGADFARQPVGTGPFMLSSWQKNKRLVLTANKEYWRGRPKVDEYIDMIEPRGEVLNSYFQQGMLDILHTYSISKTVSYKKQDWVRITSTPCLSVTFAVINSMRPPLNRKGVRQAMCYAWDPRALKLIFQDFVLPIDSLLPQGLLAEKTPAPASRFSLAKAQALMKKEGLNGEIQLEMVLQKDDGLIFELLSMYARNLKQIGIRLKLTRLGSPALEERIAQNDYDLAYSGWIADYPDPDSMMFPLLSAPLQKQGLANIAGSRRQDLDNLLKAARSERDAKKRETLYRDIDRAIIADGLAIPLYQDKRVIISNQKVGRLQTDPLGKLYLFDLSPQ